MNQTVYEYKHRLSGVTTSFTCTLEAVNHEPEEEVILRFVATEPYEVAGLLLPTGTITLAHYWQSRPYNVYQWRNPAGETIALYINIADQTLFTPDRLDWRDLVVDIVIYPDGHLIILDEDEIPDDLDDALLSYIKEATNLVIENSSALWEEITGGKK